MPLFQFLDIDILELDEAGGAGPFAVAFLPVMLEADGAFGGDTAMVPLMRAPVRINDNGAMLLRPALQFVLAELPQPRAERHPRGFACEDRFNAMLFRQLGQTHSLREICGGLASCEGKLRHLGLPCTN
jgi:hypothetical protein